MKLLFRLAALSLTRADVELLLRSPHRLLGDTFRRRRFPELAIPIGWDSPLLSLRTKNCLKKLKESHGISDLGGLSRLTVDDVLRIKGLGRKSLTEILEFILPMVIDPSPPVASSELPDIPLSALVTKAAERLRAQSYSTRIRCTDPRFHPESRELTYVANLGNNGSAVFFTESIHSVAHNIVGRSRDRVQPERILELIRRIRLKILRAKKMALEKELKEITGCFTSARNLGIMLAYYGWDGRGVKTLQAVGSGYNLTRERVRQIVGKFNKKLNGIHSLAPIYTPTLMQVMSYVERQAPASVAEMETRLSQVGLTREPFLLDGVVSAAQVFGIPIPFLLEDVHGIRTVVRNEDAGLSKLIVHLSRKVVSHAGLGKVGDLCALLEEKRGTSINGPAVVRVLKVMLSLHWLDREFEWFILTDVPRNHLINLIRKVLSIAPRIHVNEMRAAMTVDPRGMGFAPPKAVILEFCRVACQCRIEGEIIVSEQPSGADAVLSRTEMLFRSVLQQAGPLLHRSDLERRCAKEGMNLSTFSICLTRLPILARYAPGVYGLRGAQVTPGEVERCIPSTPKRLTDHGWTSDAEPWLAVELSAAALSSGVISVPAGISRFVAGRYVLRTPDGTDVGNLVVSDNASWGLGPLFRKRGGEPGDIVLLTFNLQRHEANVRIGAREAVFASIEER